MESWGGPDQVTVVPRPAARRPRRAYAAAGSAPSERGAGRGIDRGVDSGVEREPGREPEVSSATSAPEPEAAAATDEHATGAGVGAATAGAATATATATATTTAETGHGDAAERPDDVPGGNVGEEEREQEREQDGHGGGGGVVEEELPEADIPEPRAPVAEPDRLGEGSAAGVGAGVGSSAPAERTTDETYVHEDEAEEDPLPLPTPVPRTVDRHRRRRALAVGGIALLVIVLFLGVLILRDAFRSEEPSRPAGSPPAAGSPAAESPVAAGSPAAAAPAAVPPPPPQLPRGGMTIFPRHRVVAYYGSPGEPRLGVLGAGEPEDMATKLDAAAAPFATPGREVQPAMEIIVGVADGKPGPGGDYHHDVDEAEVRRYIQVARAHRQLVVLDIQPGTTDFLTASRPWEALLREPDVGLALDAEWRMAPGEVPGKTIGSVTADEVNTTSAWLAGIVREANLPQKLFVVHQFTPDMITNLERVATPPELAVVQHVDGFGAPPNKLGKYQQLQRPQQFHQGFKLFYTQDTPMLTPQQALALSPAPEFITYQ